MDITLHHEEYDKKTTYELRFKPSSIVRQVNEIKSTVKFVLSYPNQIRPDIKEKDSFPEENIGAGKDFLDKNQINNLNMVEEGC